MFPADGLPKKNDKDVVKRQEYFRATEELMRLYEEKRLINEAIDKLLKIARENR